MRLNRMWLVVLLLVAFASLMACQTPAGRSAGDVVDDATITSKVKGKLIGDEKLAAFGIDVDTFEGNVTLTGGVNTQADKDHATRLAKETTGVRKVNNLLKIKP